MTASLPAPDGQRPRGLLVFAIWTAIGLLATADVYVFRRMAGQSISLWRCWVASAPSWYVWWLATPALLRLTDVVPPWPVRARALLVHVPVCVALGLAFVTVSGTATILAGTSAPELSWWDAVVRSLLGWFSVVAVIYAAVVGTGAASAAIRRRREGEQREAALAARLVRAELDALEAQLHPHFLFNALNTAVTYVRSGDAQTADRVLMLLSDSLRELLERRSTDEISLAEEVRWLGRYLEIQQLRFADRLRVRVDVHPAVRDARVPRLLLQPLVENAIRHGIGRRAAAGLLEIEATPDGDELHLRVSDDGPGVPAGFSLAHADGIGLRNTRERLQQLYGGGARLRLENAEGGGARATVTLPLRGGAGAPAEVPA